MIGSSVTYAKESLTITCDEFIRKASEMLDWGKSDETSGNLTQGERECIGQLIPQVKVAAELFRQCAKNEETGNGKQE